jgi:hypothetical protein
LTLGDPTPAIEEPEATPVVISNASIPDGLIESVPIGSPRRSRAWLVGGGREFKPPDFARYYIYVTTQPTTFSDWKTKVVLDAKDPAVTIFPPGVNHAATLTGPAFVYGVAGISLEEVNPSAWPRTAKVARIETALKKLGGRPLRLVAGSKSVDEEEEEWIDRDWSFEDERGSLTRQVLVAKGEGFELSVVDQDTKHVAHAHQRTFESFASASDIRVSWTDTEPRSLAELGPTVVVLPPQFCHDVAPSGTAYVLRVSPDDPAVDDVTPCKISD